MPLKHRALSSRRKVSAAAAEYLEETIAVIPEVCGVDLPTKLHFETRVPHMKAFIERMWVALGATTPLDFSMKMKALGEFAASTHPATMLACKRAVDYSAAIRKIITDYLGVELTPDEEEGYEALATLADLIGKRAAAQRSALH